MSTHVSYSPSYVSVRKCIWELVKLQIFLLSQSFNYRHNLNGMVC